MSAWAPLPLGGYPQRKPHPQNAFHDLRLQLAGGTGLTVRVSECR